MRKLVLFVCLGIVMATCATAAMAQKRVALVIGNSAYGSAPKLAGPANNARAMGALFKDSAFDFVATYLDLDGEDMGRAIRDFSDRAADADIAVVFFSGHAIDVRDTSYLFPVNAKLDATVDAITIEQIVAALKPAKSLRLVVVDGSRNDPFARDRPPPSGPVDRVEPLPPNTLVAYATKRGSAVVEGDGLHGAFTTALLKHLTEPGLDIRFAFGRIRDDVMRATSGKQEPYVTGAIGSSSIALVPAGGLARAVDAEAQKRDYDVALLIGTKAAWDAFLKTYPTGFQSDLARAQRAKLDLQGAPAPPGFRQLLGDGETTTADEAACLDACVVEWLGMNTCSAAGNMCIQSAAQSCKARAKIVSGLCQRAAGKN